MFKRLTGKSSEADETEEAGETSQWIQIMDGG